MITTTDILLRTPDITLICAVSDMMALDAVEAIKTLKLSGPSMLYELTAKQRP